MRKPKGRRPLDKHAYGRKENTKVDRKHKVEGRIKDLAGSGKRQVAGLRDYGDELSSSIKMRAVCVKN